MNERPFPQGNDSFNAISQLIYKHLAERDWQDGPSRSLAISMALEAAELLEHYQWSDEPVGDRDALAAELADVFIYAFQFAERNQIDIAQSITDKLAVAAKKYPAERFKNKVGDERSQAWLDAKLHYRKEGL